MYLLKLMATSPARTGMGATIPPRLDPWEFQGAVAMLYSKREIFHEEGTKAGRRVCKARRSAPRPMVGAVRYRPKRQQGARRSHWTVHRLRASLTFRVGVRDWVAAAKRDE